MHQVPPNHTGESDNDDLPVGRILSRREVLALLGVAGASLLAACTALAVTPAASATVSATVSATATQPSAEAASLASVPSCVVRPEMTEGPYFVDAKLNRSDIRIEPLDGSVVEGTPLTLLFRVSQVTPAGCSPLAGATVDVWHCDAQGVYSGVRDPRFDTSQLSYLRGYQETGGDGSAQFSTIYPGWYSGRAVHIHFKIRTTGAAGSSYDFTSQLFFDEAVTAQVYSRPPYAEKGPADVPNDRDGIFRNGGEQLLLTPTATADGYSAIFEIGLDLSA